MTFQDETRKLSWSMTLLISLALAGCGEKAPDRELSGVAETREEAPTRTPQGSASRRDPAVADRRYRQPGSSSTGKAQPEVQIEDPILADPLPVPVPDGEGPDPELAGEDPVSPDDNRTGADDPAPEDDPDLAQPQPEDPDPVAGRPTLHWDSPLTREDGSKLYPGEISGYRIWYRLRHQDEFQSMVVETDSLSLADFEPGAWEFAISTVDVDGLESRRSDPVPVDLI